MMNSTATLSSPRAFTGGGASARLPAVPSARRELELQVERDEALKRAQSAAQALDQIRSNRCGASCLRDLARTGALFLMIFSLPTAMLLTAQALPQGNVLAAAMTLICVAWLVAALALRRFAF